MLRGSAFAVTRMSRNSTGDCWILSSVLRPTLPLSVFLFCVLMLLTNCDRSRHETHNSKIGSEASLDGASSSPHPGSPSTSHRNMVFIQGGAFLMGTSDGMPYEAPVH